jgi:hypothetical protein
VTQEAAIALQSAQGMATRDRWPAGLLPAVQLALASADPLGPDSWRGQGARWEAVAEALLEVAEARPADAAYLSRLLEVAQGGAAIDDGPLEQAAQAGADFAGGVAADVRSVAEAAPDVLKGGATLAWGVGLLGLAGLAFYALRGR